MTARLMDRFIELLLIPFLPLFYVVWLRWQAHEHEMLSVKCDGGNEGISEYIAMP